MPLKIIQRKSGGNFYIRGTVRGQGIFESTGTSDPEAAETLRIQTEARLLNQSIFGRQSTITFLEATEAFVAAGGSPRFLFELNAEGQPKGLAVHLRGSLLRTIKQSDIDKLALKLYPHALPETRLRQFYAPFRAVWNYAARQGWAEVRTWYVPKSRRKGTNTPSDSSRRAGSTATSYERAAAFVGAMSPAPAMVMTALFYTGMRPVELFALECADVDLAQRWLVIRKSKTGEPRGVPVHDFLARMFESLCKRGGKVFRTHKGEPYRILENAGGQLNSAIAGARRRSGITEISPYTARHTVSTQLVVNGVHPYVKDQILGHAVDDMSRRYTNVPQQPLIDAINGIAVPEVWQKVEWLADPLLWSGKLVNSQDARRDRKRS